MDVLGLSRKKVQSLLQMHDQTIVSLNENEYIPQQGLEYADPYLSVAQAELGFLIKKAINSVDPRRAQILQMRYSHSETTLADI